MWGLVAFKIKYRQKMLDFFLKHFTMRQRRGFAGRGG